jgi:cytochrome c oxidase assembly factor CtaG
MELFVIETGVGRLAVVVVAVGVLIGFLLWSRQANSNSFFFGVLAGTGVVLSFDIVWIHWIFGLHHVTNSQLDLVLEPLLVLAGVVFLWFGITRERRRAE